MSKASAAPSNARPASRGISWSMVTLAVAACWLVYDAGSALNSPVLWALAVGVLLGRKTASR